MSEPSNDRVKNDLWQICWPRFTLPERGIQPVRRGKQSSKRSCSTSMFVEWRVVWHWFICIHMGLGLARVARELGSADHLPIHLCHWKHIGKHMVFNGFHARVYTETHPTTRNKTPYPLAADLFCNGGFCHLWCRMWNSLVQWHATNSCQLVQDHF